MPDKQFDPYPWSLRTMIDKNFYEIPVYQRPFSWSNEQVEALLGDLFFAYNKRNEKPEDQLFTGTIFLRHIGKGTDGVKEKYEIVDGQQRMTTFSMILISIYSIALKRKVSNTSKKITDLRAFLWKYCENTDSYLKNEKLLSLNSIDKELFEYLFDNAYDEPQKIIESINKYTPKCWTEKNLIEMFNLTYSNLEKKFNTIDNILSFLSFILDKTLFIVIQSSIDMAKVFSVFESLNSKGKPLDTIDLIKTYIFSQLDEKEYSIYSSRWSQLIIKTEDNLGDYLQNYIKAFHSYYRQTINIINFKTIAKQLINYFKKETLKDALKALIDDMLDKVDSYMTVKKYENACKIIKKQSFELYYKLFIINGYQHPTSLFFKAFTEFKKGIITKDDVTEIVKSSTLFMFKFQSINGGDSKDAISIFDKIANKFYSEPHLDSKWIKKTFTDELISKGIDKNVIYSKFLSLDFYSKHDLTYSILCLLESINQKNNKLLFKQAIFMLNSIKNSTFAIDHMLPKDPKSDDNNLFYYKKVENGKEELVLKDGHDFPQDVFTGMDYSEFMKRTIGKLGNLRLYSPQLNSIKGNSTLSLPNHEDFTTYKQITDRAEKLVNSLLACSDLN